MPEMNTHATGRRKLATARVWIEPGTGQFEVNGRSLDDYFHRQSLLTLLRQPLQVVEAVDKFDIKVNVRGGGETGQAGAIRHGIARALAIYNPEWRIPLKRAGLLTRDPRTKERKKYGRPGARKRFQYSKR